MNNPIAGDLAQALRSGAPPRELARIVRNSEPAHDPILFKSISGDIAIRSGGDSAARPSVWATHSSTNTQDMHGTWWAPSALKRMLDESRGLTVFRNHKYDVPDDVFGTITDGLLVSRTTPQGTTHIDLDMCTQVETENYQAQKTYRMINNGTRLGQSVGVLLLGWEWQDADGRCIGDVQSSYSGIDPHDREDARLTITDLAMIESSVVGIPSNRRSWQHRAIDSLQLAGVLPGARALAPAQQFGGITLPEGRTVDVAKNKLDSNTVAAIAGPDTAAAAVPDAVASSDIVTAGAPNVGDTDTATGVETRTADATESVFSDGLVTGGADISALDALFEAQAGIVPAATLTTNAAPSAEKLAKKAAKAEKKALKAAETATFSAEDDDAQKAAAKAEKKALKAARKALVVQAAAPAPVAPIAASVVDTRTAELEAQEKALAKREKDLKKRAKDIRKQVKRAAKILAEANDTGLYRPTHKRDALAGVELTAARLIDMSDDEAAEALAKSIIP